MNQQKKAKLKKLLDRLDNLQKKDVLPSEDINASIDELIAEEVAKITARVKDNPTVRTLQKFSTELAKFKKDFDLKPVLLAIQDLKNEADDKDFMPMVKAEIDKRLENFKVVDNSEDLKLMREQMQIMVENDTEQDRKLKDDLLKTVDEKIRSVKINAQNRGGSMNRQININSSVMSNRWNDIDFQNTGTIGWTATDDATTKRVIIKASVLGSVGGGGGSAFGIIAVSGQNNVVASVASDTLTFIAGSNVTLTTDSNAKTVTITAAGASSTAGISRTTSIITANTTGGTTSATDYMYFANAGMTFTLPTAIGNNNQYTLKNMAATSVLVATSAGQTIDGSNTALIDKQYQTLNFISNGSVWGVT